MIDLNEHTITDAVLQAFSGTQNPRLKRILESLTKHLHDFARDVELTSEEWLAAILFLTAVGQKCDDKRQEFMLLSDTLGLTMLVDSIAHRNNTGATENSVLGPFFAENRPSVENGADIGGEMTGPPLYFEGHVHNLEGAPLAGALVDVWHSDAEGFYDSQLEGLSASAGRGLLRSDENGRFFFHSVMPVGYPIPSDGPVGDMLRATSRSVMRPAHVHVRILAPGYEDVVTAIFPTGDPYLETDAVFGVHLSTVHTFGHHEAGLAPDGKRIDQPFYSANYTFKLQAPNSSAAD
jgi:hydroxyquinol 1,2-dioxygenase